MDQTNFTPKKKLLLEGLSRHYTITAACEYAGISRPTAYAWKDEDPAFAAAWEEARNQAVERLEESAYERASRGNDVLTIFLMKGMRPEKYRDTFKADINASGEFKIRFTPEEK